MKELIEERKRAILMEADLLIVSGEYDQLDAIEIGRAYCEMCLISSELENFVRFSVESF